VRASTSAKIQISGPIRSFKTTIPTCRINKGSSKAKGHLITLHQAKKIFQWTILAARFKYKICNRTKSTSERTWRTIWETAITSPSELCQTAWFKMASSTKAIIPLRPIWNQWLTTIQTCTWTMLSSKASIKEGQLRKSWWEMQMVWPS